MALSFKDAPTIDVVGPPQTRHYINVKIPLTFYMYSTACGVPVHELVAEGDQIDTDEALYACQLCEDAIVLECFGALTDPWWSTG